MLGLKNAGLKMVRLPNGKKVGTMMATENTAMARRRGMYGIQMVTDGDSGWYCYNNTTAIALS
jgi:hypothetical protein